MKRHYFVELECCSAGTRRHLPEVLEQLAVGDTQLIPVVVQDARSKRVLNVAWMNRQALDVTLSTRLMTYWSRTRNSLWTKGETSGHFQKLQSMRIDCDGDTLLCLVDPLGAPCHTARNDCFYFEVDFSARQVVITEDPPVTTETPVPVDGAPA